MSLAQPLSCHNHCPVSRQAGEANASAAGEVPRDLLLLLLLLQGVVAVVLHRNLLPVPTAVGVLVVLVVLHQNL